MAKSAQGPIDLFFYLYVSNVGIICRLQQQFCGRYMYNVACIFVQGHMGVVWNACLPVFVVTLLIALSSYEAYKLT